MKNLLLFISVFTSLNSYATPMIDGNWSGQVSTKDSQEAAEAMFLVKGQRAVGFFKAWNNEDLPLSGYFDENNKLILKTWYDNRAFSRMELALSDNGKTLSGGTYTFERKDQNVTLTRKP